MTRKVTIGLVLLLSVALPGCPGERSAHDAAPGDGTETLETAEEFLESFTAAMRQDDRAGLLALVNWDGVGAETRESQEKTLDRILTREVESVVLAPRPENYRGGGVRDGIRYRPNVEIEGMFEVTFSESETDGIKSLSLPYGMSEGHYFIAGIVEEQSGYVGPPDRSINISVEAGGAPAAVSFEGECTYSASGEAKRQELIGEGNLSRAFWGQSVTRCSLRRTTESGWIELRINEGGRRIFESGRVETGDPIEYVSPKP